MFFGLEVKTNQNQSKPITLANTIKLSQAVLDPSKNGKKEPVCLVAEYNKKQFILCVLDPSQSWQCPLDLMFEGGSEVKFFLRGSGTVHLTGYENFDDLDSMSMSMSSDEDVEISDDSDKEPTLKIVKGAKGNKATNGTNGPSKSKAKKPSPQKSKEEDEDDDSDDDDFAAALDDDSDEEDSDADMDDEDMDDDDDDDDEEEDSEDE